jgi:hypothetical protein
VVRARSSKTRRRSLTCRAYHRGSKFGPAIIPLPYVPCQATGDRQLVTFTRVCRPASVVVSFSIGTAGQPNSPQRCGGARRSWPDRTVAQWAERCDREMVMAISVEMTAVSTKENARPSGGEALWLVRAGVPGRVLLRSLAPWPRVPSLCVSPWCERWLSRPTRASSGASATLSTIEWP